MNIIIKENQFIFLLCSSIYPRPPMHVIGQVLQSTFFHYVLPASHNHVWMHYSGDSVSFFIVLPASRDHVRMLLSKRSILYFYYVFPASHDHVWTFLSKMSGLFFFNYVLLSRYNHVWTSLSNWWSLSMFITWFQLATYECYCRFLLCVSS